MASGGAPTAAGAPRTQQGGGASPRAEPATSEQLAVLEEVLARPEFRAVEGRSALDVLLDPIRTIVQSVVFEGVRALARLLAAGGQVGAYGGLAVASAVVLGARLIVARLARGTLAAEAELAEAARSGPPRAEGELIRAGEQAAAGEFRAAVHHQYLAVLRRLDARGLLPFNGSLTNQEHLARVANPVLAEALAPLVAAFDTLWYGQASCSQEEYDKFTALAGQVVGGQWSVVNGR